MEAEEKPKLLWAASTVFTCAQCQCWVVRSPKFMGDTDVTGFECERCGATSVQMRDGRPFGPKSQQWQDILLLWDEFYEFSVEMLDAFEQLDSVKTDPPLLASEKV